MSEIGCRLWHPCKGRPGDGYTRNSRVAGPVSGGQGATSRMLSDQVSRADHELKRYQAQYKALHLEYTRLNGVFESQPGIVAQQEVDDAQGKDLAAASQVDSGEAALRSRPEPARRRSRRNWLTIKPFTTTPDHGAVRRRGDRALREPGHSGAGGHDFEYAGACRSSSCHRTICSGW